MTKYINKFNKIDSKKKLEDNEGSDIESSPKRRKSFTATIVTCKESRGHYTLYNCLKNLPPTILDKFKFPGLFVRNFTRNIKSALDPG